MSELVCRTLELLAESKGAFVSAVKNIFDTRTMTTLNISDLSVGDWVEFKGELCKVLECGAIIVSPGMIEFNPRLVLSAKYDIYDCVEVDKVRPIPITAEILEKNGFGKKTFTQDQLLRIVEPNGNVPFICYRWDSERVIIERSNDYMLRVKTKYIHQLQHALRLAGVDKEINL